MDSTLRGDLVLTVALLTEKDGIFERIADDVDMGWLNEFMQDVAQRRKELAKASPG